MRLERLATRSLSGERGVTADDPSAVSSPAASTGHGRDKDKSCLDDQIRTAVDIVVSRYGA